MVYSKHMIRSLLRKKLFLVNDYPIIYTNFILTNFECLTIRNSEKKKTFEDVRKRLASGSFFYRPPYYLEVNHKTFSCLIIQKFVERDMLNTLLSLKVKL